MADSHSSASVVITDPAKAAEERDRLARSQLSDEASNASNPRQLFVQKGVELTVPYTVKVVYPSGGNRAAIEAQVNEVLTKSFTIANSHLNNFNPESEVSRINALPAHMVHEMSDHISHILDCAVGVFTTSGGRFDPACGPAASYARAFLSNPSNKGKSLNDDPEFQEILTIASLPGGFKVVKHHKSIQKRDSRAMLDLGGVAKGYTVDLVIEGLIDKGFTDCFFDWGGDCRGHGHNTSRKHWTVGIVRPPSVQQLYEKYNALRQGKPKPEHPPASLIRVVQLDDEALATSGDYENLFFGFDDKLYTTHWSLRNKELLQPSKHDIAQSSVKCYTCLYADALASAALHERFFHNVRNMLENWRFRKHHVSDFVMYSRHNERVSKMFEISSESPEMHAKRVRDALPARVVVVGGGLAGLSAAIEAANAGAQVILMEKSAKIGGNSAKATSGINGWGTRPQALQNISDGGKFFERDTYKSGIGGVCEPGLVKMLSVKSGEAIKWLTHFGIPLTILSQLGGHSQKRCHRAPDKKDGTPVPIGFTIMKTLEDHIRTHLQNNVTLMTETSVTSLMRQVIPLPDGSQRIKCLGVTFRPKEANEDISLYADAVILATGGFSNDCTSNSLMREFAPHLFGRPTTNGAFATGDGVKMARSIGAQLIDMDKVQLHPTGFIDPKDPTNNTKYLGPEALRGSGGILLNKNGERFVNELDLRSVVSAAINAQGNEYPGSNGCKMAYCVLNEAAAKLFGRNSLEFYWKKLGLFTQVESADALAQLIGCPAENVISTLTTYGTLSQSNSGPCPATGKSVFPCAISTEGPFYVSFVTPSIHYTMGGCLISPSAEVQSNYVQTSVFGHRRPIQGLFGAGEVTGGVHGRNRLGGNSLLECVVFGRIAGDRAGTILQKKPAALSVRDWSTVILREVREGQSFGFGSKVLRFNLPGATQASGLKLGQFVSIRGDWDGKQLVGYYSPITLPDDHGVIGILVRTDKGTLKEWLNALKPGDAVEMKACGGLAIERNFPTKQMLFEREPIRRISMIAGGSGVAPMIQIIRAALKKPFVDHMMLDLIYAAEDAAELTYRSIFEQYQQEHPDKFHINFILNNPPAGWTGGVGFIDKNVLSTCVPHPSRDLLVVICGPPVMQRVVKFTLVQLGHNPRHVRTVDEESPSSSKL